MTDCRICNDLKRTDPKVPVCTDKYRHFAVGFGDPQFEYVLDRQITPEDSKEFEIFLEKSFPWTLEVQVMFWQKRGFEVVWMTKRR